MLAFLCLEQVRLICIFLAGLAKTSNPFGCSFCKENTPFIKTAFKNIPLKTDLMLTCCKKIVWGEQQEFWEETTGQTFWSLVGVPCKMDNTWKYFTDTFQRQQVFFISDYITTTTTTQQRSKSSLSSTACPLYRIVGAQIQKLDEREFTAYFCVLTSASWFTAPIISCLSHKFILWKKCLSTSLLG